MTTYAHIYGGKVQEIRETEMSWTDWCSIWDPSVFWLDITGVPNVKVGSVINFHPERGTYFTDPEELPEEPNTFEYKKIGKRELLSTKFGWASNDAWVDSGLGFRADANDFAINSISGLISLTENDLEKEIIFRDHDNMYHNLNNTQLKILYKEVLENRSALRQQKWEYEQMIEKCKTEIELEALDFKFIMMQFPLVSD